MGNQYKCQRHNFEDSRREKILQLIDLCKRITTDKTFI